jgi:deferrochelatase/peroxidase EfeB
MNVRVQADTSHFHLLISCGDTDEDSCQQLLQEHRAALDEVGERASAVHLRDGVLLCGNGESKC